MLIISDFHDYYDTAIGYGGVDKKTVFNRKTSVEKCKESPRFVGPGGRSTTRLSVGDGEIFFHFFGVQLGRKFYPGVCVSIYNKKHNGYYVQFVYDKEQLESSLLKYFKETKEFTFSYNPFSLKKENIRSILNIIGKYFDQKFPKFNTPEDEPIVLYYKNTHSYGYRRNLGNPLYKRYGSVSHNRHGEVLKVVNPELNKIEFYKCVDHYTAFQELSMWIPNIKLRNTPTHEPIPDDIMRDMKGFNEVSFRQTPPGQKKERRRRNKIRKNNKEENKR